MEPVRELAQLGDRRLQLVTRREHARAPAGGSPRALAIRSERASATRRCCAPSWMFRSSRRRSSSPAATIRVRDSCTSSSRAPELRLQPRVLETGWPRRSRLEQLGVFQQSGVVDERGDRLAVVRERRDRAPQPAAGSSWGRPRAST